MLSRSLRHQLISELEVLIRHLALDQRVGQESGSSISRDLEELVEIRAEILATRYLHSRIYDSDKNGMLEMLESYDDKGFKAEVRMDKVFPYWKDIQSSIIARAISRPMYGSNALLHFDGWAPMEMLIL